MMADLSSLAGKYDLEGDLYHGGGLQRVLDLLGDTRERKFIKSISKEKLKNKEKWVKLVAFLKEELSEREAYVLNEKVIGPNSIKIITRVVNIKIVCPKAH